MAFHSLSYFLFLPLTALAYYRLPARAQNGVLLAASLLFYLLCEPRLLPVLLAAGLATWLFAGALGRAVPGKKRGVLIAALLVLLGALAFFKYAGPLQAALARLTGRAGGFSLALPLGISFYTFTAVGYLADVAAGRTPAEKSLTRTLLLLCFFGSVSSGPILKAGEFFPQLAARRRFDPDSATRALAQLAVGLLYKVAVSDLLAVYVNAVWADLSGYTGLTLFAASVAYSLQLYFDFAGYSLLALGTGRLLGLQLPQNFNAPYFSRSVKEFWARWHISLSRWLREYVYIPLGGNRRGRARKYLNLLATFAVSGLWHGVGLGFLLWGLLHAAAQILGELWRPVSDRIYRALRLSRDSRPACLWQWLCTMAVVNTLWVLFRAGSLPPALYLLKNQFVGVSLARFLADARGILLAAFNPQPLLCLAFAAFLALAFALAVRYDAGARFRAPGGDISLWLTGRRAAARWLLYYLTAGLIFGGYLLNNGYFTAAVSFLYNNF